MWYKRQCETLYWYPHEDPTKSPGAPLRLNDMEFADKKQHSGGVHWRSHTYWHPKTGRKEGMGMIIPDYRGLMYLAAGRFTDPDGNLIKFPVNWKPALEAQIKLTGKTRELAARYPENVYGPERAWLRSEDHEIYEVFSGNWNQWSNWRRDADEDDRQRGRYQGSSSNRAGGSSAASTWNRGHRGRETSGYWGGNH